MSRADEGRGIEAVARTRQQVQRIAPGGQVVGTIAMQHDAAPDRGKIGTAVKRRDKPRQRTRRGELRVVVQRRDDPAVAEIGATVAPAGDPVVAVQPNQRRIRPPLDRGGETDAASRPRPLIDRRRRDG